MEDPPDGQRVDLIEAFLCTLLTPLGLRIRFIDTWYYHRGEGGLHCATNAMRRPRELSDRSLHWWDSYVPELSSHDPRR
ncbi:MAG: protein-arginine deiminase domain-containing protein [Sandaracinaceae bacterium]|nr:protein-arginine deiminase domain-containing protein [Sandaracinaceae bacterium]